jgi:hypothetical protein
MDVLAPEDPYREQQRCFSPRKVDRITYRRAKESVQWQVVKLWRFLGMRVHRVAPLDRLPPCTGRGTPRSSCA